MSRLSHSAILAPLAVLGVATLAWLGASTARATETPRSGVAFEQLAKFLVGKWNGVHEGTQITLTYALTANDSALMEDFPPQKGPVMITMFSVDGDHLLAAHYCSAGNLPHMATETITDQQSKRVAFTLTHVTGLKTPEDAQHRIGVDAGRRKPPEPGMDVPVRG
jgi:hypothetical protein